MAVLVMTLIKLLLECSFYMLSLSFFKPVSLNVGQLIRCSENQCSVTSYGGFLKHLNHVFLNVWV